MSNQTKNAWVRANLRKCQHSPDNDVNWDLVFEVVAASHLISPWDEFSWLSTDNQQMILRWWSTDTNWKCDNSLDDPDPGGRSLDYRIPWVALPVLIVTEQEDLIQEHDQHMMINRWWSIYDRQMMINRWLTYDQQMINIWLTDD